MTIGEAAKEFTTEQRLECALHANAEQVFEIDDMRKQLAESQEEI